MSKTRMGKRVASLLLSLVMMLSLLPTTVYATGETQGVISEEGTVIGQKEDGNVPGEGEEDAIAPQSGEEGGDAALLAEANVVAKVGDTEYASLADAIAAANAGDTVTLMSDINLGDSRISLKKTIVLDLNSYTLSSTKTQQGNVFYLDKNTQLTVKDSSAAGTGKITAACMPIQLASSGAVFTLESGTIEATNADSNGAIQTGASAGKTININGGKVRVTRTDTTYRQKVHGLNCAGTFHMTGGEVVVEVPATASVETAAGVDIGGTAEITGGTITVSHAGSHNNLCTAIGITTNSTGMVTVSNVKMSVSATGIHEENCRKDAYAVYAGNNSTGTIEVKGGEYTLTTTNGWTPQVAGKYKSSTQGTAIVSGGMFPGATLDPAYLADGCEYDEETGTVTKAAEEAYVTVNGGDKKYETLEAAIAAATPVENGVITYTISGKVDVTSTGWVQVAKAGLTGLTAVKFEGASENAEICIATATPETPAILADQNYDIDVSFENLILSRPKGTNVNDLGHGNSYFTCWLRNTGEAENTVTYTNCTFPNGVCNNQYGKTVFDGCKFNNTTTGKYNLWNYGGETEVKNSAFTGTRGIKAYSESANGGSIAVNGTSFTGLSEKAAIVVSKATKVTLVEVNATDCTKGLITRDISDNDELTIGANGTGIKGTFYVTSGASADKAKEEFNISAGTFTSEVDEGYLAEGFTITESTDAAGNKTYGVTEKAAEMDLAAFVALLEEHNYNLDGSTVAGAVDGKLLVKWSPVSGCYDTRGADHDCTVGNDKATANTPKRVNSDLAQFQLFAGKSDAVTVKNVSFVYEPAAFTICINSSWAGTFAKDKAPAGQLYFMTSGDVTFDNCKFDKVVLTSFNTTGTTTVTNCSFANVYNNYAIKDVRGANVTVTNNTITNCGGGIMVSQTANTAVTNVTITGNEFENVDVAGTAEEKKVGTRALIQIASSGSYADTAFDFADNTASNCGPALRQLNESAISGVEEKENQLNAVTGTLYTTDSKRPTYVAAINGVKYKTLAEAIAAAKDGDTVTLLGNCTVSDYELDKGVTIQSADGQQYEIKGLKAITGAGVTLENVFLNLDQTLEIGGTDTKLTNCTVRAKDVGYGDIVDGITTGFTGGKAYQDGAFTYLTRVTGTNVTMTNCLIDGTDEDNSYFPNMCLAPVSGTDVTMTRCTFNEGFAACYYSTPSGTWTLDDCKFTNIYCYNIQAGDTNANIVVKNCELAGWNSFGGSMASVSFENCDFAKSSGFATIVAYKDASFTDCTFTEDYKDNLCIEKNTTVELTRCKVVDENGNDSETVSLAEIANPEDATAVAAINAEKNAGGKFIDGTFVGSESAIAAKLAEGLVPAENGDGTYGVKEGKFVAAIGSTKYETLAAAVKAAKDGETVKLLADCESGRINLEEKSVTVDLNGKTLTSTAAYGVMFCAKNGNKITIDGTTEGSKLVGTLMVTSGTYGHIVINGGTYENAQYCPIYVNGAVSNDDSTVTITNAIVTAIGDESDQDSGVAMYLAGYAKYQFKNVKVTAPVTGIEIRAGELTLDNCTVTGGSGTIEVNANGNGTTVKNAALAISQHNTEKNITITINGGTYTGTAALYQTNVQGTGSAGVKAEVKAGTFNGIVKAETDKTIAISGGTFSEAVPENCCAVGYIPAKNENGTYTVKEGKYVIEVTSRTTGSASPVANVSGGGVCTYAEGTTVTASAVSGYTFVGWYVGYTTNNNGTLVSKERSFLYTPTADVTLTAVYQPVSGGTAKLEVTASRFTITDRSATQKGYQNYTLPVDSLVTVEYTDKNYTFLYWVNGSEKVVSTSKEYTFTLGSNTTLSAVVADKETEQYEALVVFMSAYEQVMSAQSYSTEDTIEFPAGPSKMGNIFVGWSMTEAEIKAAMANQSYIVVKPLYEATGEKYTITVQYEGIEKASETYALAAGESKLITAAETVDGNYFQYWKDANGAILSYRTAITVINISDVTVTAVYGENETQKEAIVRATGVTGSDLGNGKYKLSFSMYYAVLDGQTVTKIGFVGTKSEDRAESLTLDNNDFEFVSNLRTQEGSYTANFKITGNATVLYCKAYVQYKDVNGAVQTLYSDVISASYDSLNQEGE